MKSYVLAIALIALSLWSPSQPASEIAIAPTIFNQTAQQPSTLSEHDSQKIIELWFIALCFLGIPAIGFLYQKSHTVRARTLQQQVEALEKLWKINSPS